MPEPMFSMLEYVTLELPFEEELAAFRRGGAMGVGITEFTGPKGRDIDAMREALAEARMPVTLCWPEVPSVLPLEGFEGEEDPVARTEQLCEGIRRLSALDPIGISCLTGAQGVFSKEEARRHAVDGLRRAATVAAECGVKLAIEPIHPSIASGLSLVSTVTETMDLIAETGSDNIGIVFDIWHLWDSPGLHDEIRRDWESFLIVHLCDWRDPTRSWADRALPGQGIGDVPGILGALEAAGYHGWYELEVISDNGTWGDPFPDSLWELDPEALVRVGHEAFLRCRQEAGSR